MDNLFLDAAGDIQAGATLELNAEARLPTPTVLNLDRTVTAVPVQRLSTATPGDVPLRTFTRAYGFLALPAVASVRATAALELAAQAVIA